MAHWRMGQKDEAGRWYTQAIDGIEANKSQYADVGRLRAEVAALLGVPQEAKPGGRKEVNAKQPSNP
jgi:hypothetical protein